MKKATKYVGKKWRSCRLNQTPHTGNTRNPPTCVWYIIWSVNPLWHLSHLYPHYYSRSQKTTTTSSVDYVWSASVWQWNMGSKKSEQQNILNEVSEAGVRGYIGGQLSQMCCTKYGPISGVQLTSSHIIHYCLLMVPWGPKHVAIRNKIQSE
jgi:hypothetical protein